MREDGLAYRARPHPERAGQLAGLGVTRQVLPQAALVDVVLAAHWARVIRSPPLRYVWMTSSERKKRQRSTGGDTHSTLNLNLA